MTSRLLVDKIEGKTTASAVQMPSGSIVQIVQTNSNTQSLSTTTSTSFTEIDTDFRATITPKFSNSKILFFCKFLGPPRRLQNSQTQLLLRDLLKMNFLFFCFILLLIKKKGGICPPFQNKLFYA